MDDFVMEVGRAQSRSESHSKQLSKLPEFRYMTSNTCICAAWRCWAHVIYGLLESFWADSQNDAFN
jgi:hypothetical protein